MKNVDCFIILTLSKIASPFLNVRQKWMLGINLYIFLFWFLTFLQYFLIFAVLNNLSKPNLLIFIQYQVGQFQMPLQFSKIINSSKRFLPVSNFALLSKIASVQYESINAMDDYINIYLRHQILTEKLNTFLKVPLDIQ